ncbi:hypothetical protein [Sphingobacterium sp. 40-24]|uniref:hypothetical protein n=1 Tax=Sphingobacterium sp. 40-24 TaxID=1895843 RepID=UPI00095DC507|nr:hypothetical protein [Sphingobacterium sp. 40-24]OJZ01257.1 MAG: hypothetical protein BGP15_03390 [Sphingobacterium sp. 40-24]
MPALALGAGLAALVAAIIEVVVMAIIIIAIIAAIILIAYIVYKVVELVQGWINDTADDVWDDTAPPVDVPIPVPETKPIEIPIPIPLTVPIDKDVPSESGPFNVYDVHVNVPGDYGDYQRGVADPDSVFMGAGEIYKYGITKYGSVLRRYEAFSWTSPKESMILRNLRSGIFGPYEWYAFRRSYAYARFIENGLIAAYFAIRGKLPPGNTGYY